MRMPSDGKSLITDQVGRYTEVEDGFTNIAFEDHDLEASHQYGLPRKQSVTPSHLSAVTVTGSGKKYRVRRSSADRTPRTKEYRIRKALLTTCMVIAIVTLALFFIIRHEVNRAEDHPHLRPHPPIETHHWEHPGSKTTTTHSSLNVTRTGAPLQPL